MTYGCIESFKLFKTGLRATKTETVKSWDRPRHASSHTHTFNMLRTRQHTFAVSPERRGGEEKMPLDYSSVKFTFSDKFVI